MHGTSLAVRAEAAVIALLLDSGHFARDTLEAEDAGTVLVVPKMMPAEPVNVFVVTGYNETTDPDPSATNKSALVQVRVRAESVWTINTADQDINRLLDVTGIATSAGHYVNRCYRVSSAFLGQDSAGNVEATFNYRIY